MLDNFPSTKEATNELIFYMIIALILFTVIYHILEEKAPTYIKFIIFSIPVIIYISIILHITVLDRNYTVTEYYNFNLFWSYRYEYTHPGDYSTYFWCIQNILLFVPLGFLLCYLIPDFKHLKYPSVILFSMLLSTCVELYQFKTKVGLCELDDIFNNSLGGLIGVGIFFFQKKLYEKRPKIAVVGIIPAVLSAIVLIGVFKSY